jgi:hypothetical protein
MMEDHMQAPRALKFTLGLLAGGAVVAVLSIHPASADIVWVTGNNQYTNVNIAAVTNANTIVGDIGNTGYTMTFNSMIGPAGQSPYEMHGQHGVAFVESYADSVPSVTHTGFSWLTLTAQAGTWWTAGDLSLDLLAGSTQPGSVTFTGLDSLGTALTLASLPIDVNGQNPYNFVAINGEHITSITMQAALLQDIKQVSLNVSAVPLPAALPLFATGLVGLVLLGRRRKRKLSATLAEA